MSAGHEVETVAGPDGPRLTKRTTTDAGRPRLQREVARLHQARHPGVVEVVEHSDCHIVFAWAGGQTLTTFRAPVAVAAAIMAATATTVADLHELQIIHGRLDPSHVVIGADGRPRLCGMAGPEPSATPPTEADDVAALGQLIEGLIGAEAEAEPIPERRWNRRRLGGFQRRALQTLADQATADDPTHRPTARALATAIAEAVPEARLQSNATADPESPAPVKAMAAPQTAGRHLRQRPPRQVPALVIVLLGAVAIVGAVSVVAARADTRQSSAAALPTPVVTQRTPPTTRPQSETGPRPETTDAGTPYAVAGTSIRAEGRTYALGRKGDRVAVGDWDCNGTMTPGLVRPSTGEIFLFASWAGTGTGVTISPTAVLPGAASLRANSADTACAAPVVAMADGTMSPLRLGGSK